MSCLETTLAISLSALGSYFLKDEKATEMCCGENSRDSKGCGNQISELLWSMCCPDKPVIRTQLLPPPNILKYLKGCPRASSLAFSERVAPEHKPGSGQEWEAVELTEIQVSTQGLTPELPHWVVCPTLG